MGAGRRMTRCDAFWKKIATIREDKEAMSEFCEKSPRMIRDIADHSGYCERHLDNSKGGALVPLDEKSARPLRKLERQNPALHDKALELVRELEKPTANEVKTIVAKVVDAPEFKSKIYDVWSFSERDPRYGQEGYKWGLIAGQIVENLLYYYTEPYDCVLDPMAGGGTTVDVCEVHERTCLAFDINPIRDDIHRHDITKGPPPCNEAALAIIEPPYFNMKQDAYKDLTEYLTFIRYAVRNTAERVKDGGYIALITMDQVVKGDRPYPLIGEAYIILKENNLTFEHLISLPLTTQQYNPQQVMKAKKNKSLLGINRQMWVMRK